MFSVAQSCPTLCDPMGCSPPRLLCPQNSPDKNTGVGCHFLLQGLNPSLPHGRKILYCLSHQGLCIDNACWRLQGWRRKKGLAPSTLLPVPVSISVATDLHPGNGSSFLQQQLNPLCSVFYICRSSFTVPPSETPAPAKQRLPPSTPFPPHYYS